MQKKKTPPEGGVFKFRILALHLGQALVRWSSPPESPWTQPESEDSRPYPKVRLESDDSADPKIRSSVRGKPLLLVAFSWLSRLPKEASDPPDRAVVSDAERLRPFRNLDSTSRFFSTPCYVASEVPDRS